MKKLMFGLAIAAVGSAFAVESSNIVGYNQTALQEDGKLVGFGFIQVNGTAAMDLTEVTVSGYEDSSSDEVEVQTLDSLGRTVKTYTWQDYTKKGVTYRGWYDTDEESFIEENAAVFSAGTGLWVVAPDSTYIVNCNGQVYTNAVSVILQQDGKLVANPYPTTVDITSTWIAGYEDSSSDEVEAQTLDSLGRTVKTYTWQDYTKKGTSYYGWYDADEEEFVEPNTAFFGAGEALWVVAPDSTYNFNFPGLTL